MTEEQFEKLAALIRCEAEYAVDEQFNRNSGSEWLRREAIRKEAHDALVEKKL